jgi:DNA-binding NarL/FixJ family response regulator
MDSDMTLRIVLVDDTPEIRFLLRVGLEVDGRFEVVGEAVNGLEAIDIAAAERPDAVLLDLAMPVMDGLEAIPKIIEASPDTKIVVLTAFDAGQMYDEAISRGASAYIEKGVEVEHIADKISAICAA